MAITTVLTRLFSFQTTKDMGLPNGFGEVYFGWSQFGDWNIYAGTYARVDTPGGREIVRKRHMWPVNPQTVAQQARRIVFANGVQAWRDLTDEQRSAYNIAGNKKAITGYNLFLSEYLKLYA